MFFFHISGSRLRFLERTGRYSKTFSASPLLSEALLVAVVLRAVVELTSQATGMPLLNKSNWEDTSPALFDGEVGDVEPKLVLGLLCEFESIFSGREWRRAFLLWRRFFLPVKTSRCIFCYFALSFKLMRCKCYNNMIKLLKIYRKKLQSFIMNCFIVFFCFFLFNVSYSAMILIPVEHLNVD